MNEKAIEISLLYSQMQDQLMSLDAELAKCEEVTKAVQTVERLMDEVRQFGYNDTTVARLQRCDALKDVSKVGLCIKYKSIEGLEGTEQSGLKKFFETIGAVIQKIVEFLQNLFNTTSAKCRQIIKDRSLIKLDVECDTYVKDEFKKLGVCVNLVSTYVENRVHIFNSASGAISAPRDIIAHLDVLTSKTEGILTYDKHNFTLGFGEKLPQTQKSTLENAGWSVNDGTNLASTYLNKAKNYSSLGLMFKRFFNYDSYMKISEGQTYENRQFVKAVFNADTAAYSVMAKLQSFAVRQILAFYKCIDASNVIAV
jgi:hypothetical protein